MMSAPVPARRTRGIALLATRPRLPSATVNLRGSGATKFAGAAMLESARSSTADARTGTEGERETRAAEGERRSAARPSARR